MLWKETNYILSQVFRQMKNSCLSKSYVIRNKTLNKGEIVFHHLDSGLMRQQKRWRRRMLKKNTMILQNEYPLYTHKEKARRKARRARSNLQKYNLKRLTHPSKNVVTRSLSSSTSNRWLTSS